MSESCIYFLKPVGMDGPIKIGSSFLPVSRLDAFMQWSPFPLELITTTPGDLTLERNIHNCFADDHSHSEWFRASPRLLAAIENIKVGIPAHVAIDLSDIRGNVLGMTANATRMRNGNPTSAEARRINAAKKASET